MSLPVRRPDAAGIDIGAEEIWVAVPPDQDREPVRRFGSFTRELLALADWLLSLPDHQCGDGGDRPRLDSVVADPGGAKAGSDGGPEWRFWTR